MSEMRVGVWMGCSRNTLICFQYLSLSWEDTTQPLSACLIGFGSLDRWIDNMDSTYGSELAHDVRRWIWLVALKEEVSTCMEARKLVRAWLRLLKVNDGCWGWVGLITPRNSNSTSVSPAELPVCQQKAQTHCWVRQNQKRRPTSVSINTLYLVSHLSLNPAVFVTVILMFKFFVTLSMRLAFLFFLWLHVNLLYP